MEILNSSRLDLSKTNSELFSIRPNEPTRKATTKSDEQHFLKTFLSDSLDTFDTPSTKALIKIVLSRHILLKIFFLIFVLGSTGFASYLVTQSIMNYLAYDVTTKSRTIHETRDS